MSAAPLLRGVGLALALGISGADAGPGAPPPVTLPDTGLFAPVAEQYRAALRASHASVTTDAAERVRHLLDSGQHARAARLVRALGDEPASLPARARVALAIQDFPAMARIQERLAASQDAEARALSLAWDFARDASERIALRTRAQLRADQRPVPEMLAAARLAYEMLDYGRADSLARLALEASAGGQVLARRERSAAHRTRALVLGKRRDWDGALAECRSALEAHASSEALETLAGTLIRLGRVDEAISAAEWAVRVHPYDEAAHYLLGNGYARKNYTQLTAAYSGAFADTKGKKALADADAELAAGRQEAARKRLAAIVAAHPGWVDARVRLASLDFELGRFEEARDGCFAALLVCPEYGRAHAILAKALESQRFAVDVHRADYERRFAAAPMPDVPGIERFVVNWRALTPRHQKRVALSIAPWKAFVPVLVGGGATFYIKPLHQLLGECPNLETLRDQRISYDSRLWDDVRGCGGYHTVTGIEDVERTIFDRYNTVLHELTHQVHAVLPADDARVIQDHYRRAKERDDATRNGFLSRYAGGSVHEYFAEGANAVDSPRRDDYDPREVVRERLGAMDPDLETLVRGLLARTDVSASYPVAYAAGGDDRVQRGRIDEALPFFAKALAAKPDEETALISYANALVLGGRGAAAESIAARAVGAHPASGPARIALADARWHAGRGVESARAELVAARAGVRAEDRHQVDIAIGGYAWTSGDAAAALAAYDSVIAYQSDNPQGLQGRAASLALAGRHEEAIAAYDAAVRMRTGIVGLRCDYARDLLRAGRPTDAARQLEEAALLDPENPTAEALRGWLALERGDPNRARTHVQQALAWGPWSDLARIVEGGIAARAGDRAAAERAWAPVRERIAKALPPEYVYRPKIAVWEHVHVLPAVERSLIDRFASGVAE